MPPKGDPLTPEQIAKLKAWIDQGAKYEEHWAYVKPVQTAVPRSQEHGMGAQRHRPVRAGPAGAGRVGAVARGGQADAAAPRQPRPDRPAADVARNGRLPRRTRAPDAYEKAVDRLLASPHYGEHLARYWLDLARYADTNGYEKDDRRTIWPYRDWVINAFNRDMPFDQFTIEQIAGDLLPNATLEQKIATGFHRNTMVNTEGGTDDEEFRVAAVVDRVNTTMDSLDGHDHRLRPVPQPQVRSVYAEGVLPALRLLQQHRGPRPEQRARAVAADAANRRRRSKELQDGGRRPQEDQQRPGVRVRRRRGCAARSCGQRRWQNSRRLTLKPATTLVMKELPQPRPTHVMIRGNFKNLGEEVKPGVPAKLHPLPAGQPRQPARPGALAGRCEQPAGRPA